MPRCLGRLPARHDERTLHFSRYTVAAKLPPEPASADWHIKAAPPWGMMRNDEMGCCAIASPAHAIQAWTANQGPAEIQIPDAEVVKAYSAVSGYDPATGANDNGCVMLDVLKYWKNTGIGGRKIGAYVSVNPKNLKDCALATWMFGGLLLGIGLPLASQQQKVWSMPNVPWWAVRMLGPAWQPGSWGGHAVYMGKYTKAAGATCVTWGEEKQMSWPWFVNYVEEAWAVLSTDWTDGTKPAPSGFDLATLQADLALL